MTGDLSHDFSHDNAPDLCDVSLDYVKEEVDEESHLITSNHNDANVLNKTLDDQNITALDDNLYTSNHNDDNVLNKTIDDQDITALDDNLYTSNHNDANVLNKTIDDQNITALDDNLYTSNHNDDNVLNKTIDDQDITALDDNMCSAQKTTAKNLKECPLDLARKKEEISVDAKTRKKYGSLVANFINAINENKLDFRKICF